MHHFPILKVAGLNLDLAALTMITITSVIVLVIARLATRNLSVTNPSKMQNFMEWLVDFVRGIIGNSMDWKKGKAYLSLGLTLIMFIFVSNMLGLPLSIVTEHHEPFKLFGHEIVTQKMIHKEFVDTGEKEYGLSWWKSPTADASVSMGLAGIIFIMSHLLGLVTNTKGYLKHYFEPFWFFFPINLIEQFSKLLTHGMRLFGNIYAGEVLIGVLISAGWGGILGLVVWQGFSIFIGTIQSFIFVVLTMVYISQTTVHHSEDH